MITRVTIISIILNVLLLIIIYFNSNKIDSLSEKNKELMFTKTELTDTIDKQNKEIIKISSKDNTDTIKNYEQELKNNREVKITNNKGKDEFLTIKDELIKFSNEQD